MLSIEDEIKIAAVQLDRLESEIVAATNAAPSVQSAKFQCIDEFCRQHRQFWKHLTAIAKADDQTGLIDDRIATCVDRILDAFGDIQRLLEHVVLLKASSILSALLDCTSKEPAPEWSSRSFSLLRFTLKDILKATNEQRIEKDEYEVDPNADAADHSSTEAILATLSETTGTPDALESWYEILEIFSKDLRPRLSLDELMRAIRTDFTAGVLTMLDRAAACGRTKIVAKICSSLFQEAVLIYSEEDVRDLAEEMLCILRDDSKDDEEHSTIETRCVGLHCLVSSMKRIATRKTSTDGDHRNGSIQAQEDDDQERRISMDFRAVLENDSRLLSAIHRYLISDKVFVRKCGRSILSSMLDYLNEKCRSKDAFADFLTLMEALELKQLHVVKPAFGLLNVLVNHCRSASNETEPLSMKRFGVPWLRLAFYNALNHVNAYVVKWAIGNYFEVDSQLLKTIVGDQNCEFLFHVVLPVLDRSDAYYRFSEEDGLQGFLNSLERFFRDVIQVWTPDVFWKKWLSVMKDYHRAPVSLFYLSHILSIISDDYIGEVGVFDASDLATFRSIFWEFRQIPVPFIRAAVQEANMKIMFNLCEWNEIAVLKACSKVLSVVPARLIRPEKAKRLMDGRNDFSWILEESISSKLIAFAASNNGQGDDEAVDGSLWTVDGLRALMAVISAIGQAHPTSIENVFRSVILSLQALLKATMLEHLHFHEIGGRLRLSSTWMERSTDEAWRVIDTAAPELPPLILDTMIWSVCSGEDMYVAEIKLYIDLCNVILAPRTTSKTEFSNDTCDYGRYLQQLQKAYCDSVDGGLRRYFILQLYVQFLARSSKSILQEKPMQNLSERLILDETDCLKNVGKKYGPLEWNRIVSEYAASKWQCLFLLCKGMAEDGGMTSTMDWKRLAEYALDALDVVSGAEEIHCVMRGTGCILRQLPAAEHTMAAKIAKKMFLACFEQRKSDQFVPTVRHCCSAILQPALLFCDHDDVLAELEKIVHSFITETENPSLACCVSETINRAVMERTPSVTGAALTKSQIFLLNTLVELCCTGNLLRKDQKILYDASEIIKEFGADTYKCVEIIESDHLAGQKTRLYAFHAVLSLLEKSNDRRPLVVAYLVELARGKVVELICGATKNGYFANSQCHRVRTRAVQLLLVIEPYIDGVEIATELQQFTLRYLVEQNQQPSVRLLLEWLMTRLNLRFASKGLLEKWWDAEAYMIEKRVGTLCTWMEVLMHIGLCLPPDERRKHTLECVKRWLPWCTAQNFTLRCCAQTCLRRLWTEEQTAKVVPSGDTAWNILVDFLAPTIMFDKEQRNNVKNVEKASRDFYFSVFNVTRDYTLQTVFHTFPRLCFLPVDELIPVDLWRLVQPNGQLLCRMPIENPSDELAKGNVFVWRDRTQEALAEEINHVASYESLQTKTNLFGGDTDAFVEDILDDMKRSETMPGKDGGLVVVATLVDRPTNLGGLCRTCEIFGASEYAVSTYRVAEDFQFQVLSVSSERWVKMIEVKAADLMNYLKRKQSDGYTIIAVEQTTTSRRLTSYEFPAKTLLLLGNEKQGIPVDLLQCVDVCVEIPQLGHTRSLNVHVAGALLIWEYTKQHRFVK